MTLKEEYGTYLEHFGSTSPIRTLHDLPQGGVCGLRHDVVHSLDIALEMAHLECARGFQATYFVSPSAPYWSDPGLVQQCLQLQDYGHEVGLHLNVLAQWFRGETDHPEELLRKQLDPLRAGGVLVSGFSSQEDTLCYSANFINYWIFQDLKPGEPVVDQTHRTADGLRSQQPCLAITYPEDHAVTREDGETLQLWSMQMKDFGLDYHASHVAHDKYFSDVGGGWRRTPDPLGEERGDNRWQVTVHPTFWQAPGKKFFFLSTARSGSTWVAEVLNQATPVTARHEFFLNQDFVAGKVAHKNTSAIPELQVNLDVVRKLLSDASSEIQDIPGDYAEVNVYLSSFIKELKNLFPNATYIHLRRNPAEVVRSLMERKWFLTVPDARHPVTWEKGATPSSQFERVCHYVAQTQSFLDSHVDFTLSFNHVSSTIGALARELESIGIPVHQRLGASLIGRPINASSELSFPPASDWPEEYSTVFSEFFENTKLPRYSEKSAHAQEALTIDKERVRVKNLNVENEDDLFFAHVVSTTSHSYLTFGGSQWSSRKAEQPTASTGWPTLKGSYLRGTLRAEKLPKASMAVYGLSFGPSGLLSAELVAVLTADIESADFSFTPHSQATSIDVALYVPANESLRGFTLWLPSLTWVSP